MDVRKRLDVQRVKGATEVYVEGYSGESLRIYRGGPKDTREFVRLFARIVQSIVDAAAKGESGE